MSGKQDWDDLANLDPFWFILSDSAHKNRPWNAEEFFQTGEREIADLMASAAKLGFPTNRERALDFGCGVGRTTRALAKYFSHCDGVDVSEIMITKAAELNNPVQNCSFFVIAEGPPVFSEGYNLIYSRLVFQHLAGRNAIASSISELFRALNRNGLFVFQIPSFIPIKYRIQPKRRLYHVLRFLGIGSTILYKRLGLSPVRMQFIPRDDVIELIHRLGARLLQTEGYTDPASIEYVMYYTTKE